MDYAPGGMKPSDPMPATPFDPADGLFGHGEFMRRLARRLLADDARADDVVQEAWMAALVRPPTVRPEGFGPWLRTVVRNFALRSRRENARRDRRERAAARRELDGASTADLVEREQTLRAVTDAVLELPPAAREVVLLRFYEGLPPREIAARLDLPTTTVQSRLQHAVERLRARLDERRGRDDWRAGLAAFAGLRLPRATGAAPRAAALAGTIAVAAAVVFFAFPSGDSRTHPAAPRSAAVPSSAHPGPPTGPPSAVARAPFAETKTEPAARAARIVRGRALDDAGRPYVGAQVRVRADDGAAAESVADVEGRFTARLDVLRADRRTTVAVALYADGRAALTGALFDVDGPAEVDVGEPPFAPASPLVVRVTDHGRPAVDCRVFLVADDPPTPRFSERRTPDLPLERGATDASGAYTTPPLPPGAYVIRAVAGDRAAVMRVETPLPPDATPHLALAPAPGRRYLLRDVDGRPLAGRAPRIGVLSADPPTWSPLATSGASDAEGRLDIAGLLPHETPTVDAGFAIERATAAPVGAATPGAAAEADVVLPLRGLRAPLSAPGPAEGAALVATFSAGVDRAATAAAGTVRGGEAVFDAAPPEGAAVVGADDERLALLFVRAAGPVVPLAFSSPRTARLRLVDAAGAPVAGVDVDAVVEFDGLSVVRAATTDAAGRAAWTGLPAAPTTLRARQTTGLGPARGRLAALDLTAGDAAADVALGRAFDVLLRVARKDGAPPVRRPKAIVDGATTSPFRYDAATGALTARVLLAPDAGPPLALVVAPGDGYWIGRLDPAAVVEERLAVDARLTASTALRVVVTPPADGRFDLRLETEARLPGRRGPLRAPRRIDLRTFAFDDLPPERVRCVDVLSGARSPWIDEAERAARPEAAFDLGAAGDVRIDVRTPQDVDRGEAAVRRRLDDDPAADTWHAVGADGTLALRVPGDRPVALLPRHPQFRPAHGCEEPVVRAAGGALTLVFVDGGMAEARLVPGGFPAGATAQCLLFAAGTSRFVEGRTVRLGAGGALRFGGYLAGRYDLRIDVAGRAPTTVFGLDLDDDDQDLGEIALPVGATLRVLPRPPAGETPPLEVVAYALDEPSYRRDGVRDADGAFTISGLGAGRFRVLARTAEGAARPRLGQAVWTCDGAAAATLEVPLR